MHKKMLAQALHDTFPDLPPAVIAKMTAAIFDMIMETVARGDTVEIRNFGSFFPSELSRRLLHNPLGGGLVEAPNRRLPKFRAGQRLRAIVNRCQ